MSPCPTLTDLLKAAQRQLVVARGNARRHRSELTLARYVAARDDCERLQRSMLAEREQQAIDAKRAAPFSKFSPPTEPEMF